MATITYNVSMPYDLIALHTAAQLIIPEERELWIDPRGIEALSVFCWNYLAGENAWPKNAVNGDDGDIGQLQELRTAAEKFEICAVELKKEVERRLKIMDQMKQ